MVKVFRNEIRFLFLTQKDDSGKTQFMLQISRFVIRKMDNVNKRYYKPLPRVLLYKIQR